MMSSVITSFYDQLVGRFQKYNIRSPRQRTYRPPPRLVTTTQGPVFEFDQKSSFDLAPSGYTLTLLLLGGLGAAAAGFLAFRSSTTSSRAVNSDNEAFLSI